MDLDLVNCSALRKIELFVTEWSPLHLIPHSTTTNDSKARSWSRNASNIMLIGIAIGDDTRRTSHKVYEATWRKIVPKLRAI